MLHNEILTKLMNEIEATQYMLEYTDWASLPGNMLTELNNKIDNIFYMINILPPSALSKHNHSIHSFKNSLDTYLVYLNRYRSSVKKQLLDINTNLHAQKSYKLNTKYKI